MGNILIENGKAVGAFGNPIPANLVSYNGSNVETALDGLNADMDGIKIKSIDGTTQNSVGRQTLTTLSDATTIYGIVATVEISLGNVSVPVGVSDGQIEVAVIGKNITVKLNDAGVSTFGNKPIHVVAFYK